MWPGSPRERGYPPPPPVYFIPAPPPPPPVVYAPPPPVVYEAPPPPPAVEEDQIPVPAAEEDPRRRLAAAEARGDGSEEAKTAMVAEEERTLAVDSPGLGHIRTAAVREAGSPSVVVASVFRAGILVGANRRDHRKHEGAHRRSSNKRAVERNDHATCSSCAADP
ncbi:hypothetical protein PRNP1_002776 [Phytophthora ramorum]